MSLPLVTIGVPFFNASRWLFDAIKSVFAQTFTDWELILMDDGSMDDGAEIARSIRDPRVRVFSDGRNVKVTARRNQIVELARGEYLAWLDADDLMHPDRLAKQVQFLDTNPTIDVVGTGMYILDAEGHVVGKRYPNAHPKASCTPSQLPLSQPTVMGRIGWFRENLQDASLARAADMELWLRTAPYSHFANLPELLCFYTEPGFASPEKYRHSWRSTRDVIRRHGPRLVGTVSAYGEILKGFAKVAVFTAAYYSGLQGYVVRRRTLPLSPDEKAAAEAVLKRVREQSLAVKQEHAVTPTPG